MKDRAKLAAMEEELAGLKLELAGINAMLAQVKPLETRRDELTGGWGGRREGLIGRLASQVAAEKCPIWRPVTAGYGGTPSRIIAVGDKWISTRSDGWHEITRYNRVTGRREHARDDSQNVDIAALLKIWEDWNKEENA